MGIKEMKEKSIENLEKLFANYNDIAKWSFLEDNIVHSYNIQVKTISNIFNKKTNGIKILEAGPGAGYTANILKLILNNGMKN